jgi:hypothetical protein
MSRPSLRLPGAHATLHQQIDPMKLANSCSRPTLGILAVLATGVLSTASLRAQATFQVVNNFEGGNPTSTDYFGGNYSDDQVWLYFLNTGGFVTYTGTNNAVETVADTVAIPLSSVTNGTFSVAAGSASTRVFAGLGATNPFSGSNGPGLFDQNVPYALAEWTVNGNVNDNVDVSYEDQFSFPTKLTVVNSSGTQSAGFVAGTTAASVVQTLSTRMPTSPTGPANSNYPTQGQVGYGPLIPTVSGNTSANRWIGSSKTWTSGANGDNLRSVYQYAPSFNDYLAYLQTNEPTTVTNSGTMTGWYIDYSGNGGYSGYLTITGSGSTGYGLQISNIRVNTAPSAANDWQADPNAGDTTTGMILVTANGAVVVYEDGTPLAPDGTDVVGNWTDATIYTGASLINPDFASGPIITSTGDFALSGTYNAIVPTFIASISASMATGLLGSAMYNTAYNNPTDPKSTMYWFNTMTREQSTQLLFGEAWGLGQEFYDPYWATMAELTGMEGYLSPFNDRWANFSPDFGLIPGDTNTIVWELGIAVPEPGTAALAIAGLTAMGLRRRRQSGTV